MVVARVNPQEFLTESAVDPNANSKYDARNHSLVLSIAVTRLLFKPTKKASVFCWYLASRLRSRWRGTVRLSRTPTRSCDRP
jgi:hypothetical protein